MSLFRKSGNDVVRESQVPFLELVPFASFHCIYTYHRITSCCSVLVVFPHIQYIINNFDKSFKFEVKIHRQGFELSQVELLMQCT